MKLRVYLDASIFSAYYDERNQDRKAQTEELWYRFAEFVVSTSEVTLHEFEKTQEMDLRNRLRSLLKGVIILPLTSQMEELARGYIRRGIFTERMSGDARHVAVATLTRQDILLSWNLRHLANTRKRAQVNDFNASLGHPEIMIITPLEI